MTRLRNGLLCLALSSLTSPLLAWGERGHDAITRIAARLLAADENPEVAAWGKLLTSKEHMLGHLSNIPDIAWRKTPELDAMSSPSHFIDFEYILPEGKLKAGQGFPMTIAAYKKAILANCSKSTSPFCAPGATLADKVQKTGHAPFRIQAMTQELQRLLSELKSSQRSTEAKTELLNQALLYAGVLAHFVGDLSNPHHTTADYDGWDSEQGGLHSYFESEIVDSFDLALESSVYEEAHRHRPAQALFANSKSDVLLMSWELVRNSHENKSELTSLDRRVSLLKGSVPDRDKTKKQRAQRRAPVDVQGKFRDFIVLRMAVGADALAQIWKTAWVNAQQPDLSFYRSYAYPLDPAFIPLGYDVKSEP